MSLRRLVTGVTGTTTTTTTTTPPPPQPPPHRASSTASNNPTFNPTNAKGTPQHDNNNNNNNDDDHHHPHHNISRAGSDARLGLMRRSLSSRSDLSFKTDDNIPDLVDALLADFPPRPLTLNVHAPPTSISQLAAPLLEASEWRVGDFVERLDDDMEWHLEAVVSRSPSTHKLKTLHGSWLQDDAVRCPEAALKHVFGPRPWVFQQWALLKLEKALRFDDGHECDFATFRYTEFATALWENWLHDKRNADFAKAFHATPDRAQALLIQHIMSPFTLLAQMSSDGWWDDTHEPSLYQYLSFLGSGAPLALLIAFVQVLAPVFIVAYAMRTSERYAVRGHGLCGVSTPNDVAGMSVLVWIVYAVQVLPDVYDQVFCTLGNQASTSSRINSLRLQSWTRRTDNAWMRLGFCLDRFLNGAYTALAFLIMLWVFFLSDSALDVLLNALAISALVDFDNDIASASWFDPDKRFLKAACVEHGIRANVNMDAMRTPQAFKQAFGLDEAKWPGPLEDAKAAHVDDANDALLTTSERVWLAAGQAATKAKNVDAVEYVTKTRVRFGVVDSMGGIGAGLFHNFEACHVWSRWNAVLFAGPLGSVGPGGPVGTPPRPPPTTVNFSPYSTFPSMGRFVAELRDVLTLRKFHAQVALARGQPWASSTSAFEAADWVATAVIVAFPVLVGLYGPFIAVCHLAD